MSLKFKPLIVCGPSGSGKSTLTKYLLNDFKDHFQFSVSSTTRKQRSGETPNVDYIFTTVEAF